MSCRRSAGEVAAGRWGRADRNEIRARSATLPERSTLSAVSAPRMRCRSTTLSRWRCVANGSRPLDGSASPAVRQRPSRAARRRRATERVEGRRRRIGVAPAAHDIRLPLRRQTDHDQDEIHAVGDQTRTQRDGSRPRCLAHLRFRWTVPERCSPLHHPLNPRVHRVRSSRIAAPIAWVGLPIRSSILCRTEIATVLNLGDVRSIALSSLASSPPASSKSPYFEITIWRERIEAPQNWWTGSLRRSRGPRPGRQEA